MAGVSLGEARLVAVAIDSPDPGFTATTALSRGDNGVAHASIRQPARTAKVQAITPGRVQLGLRGQLGTVCPAEGLGLPEGETPGGGAMEHLTCAQKDGSLFTSTEELLCYICCYIINIYAECSRLTS